jgi:hypothetical protein
VRAGSLELAAAGLPAGFFAEVIHIARAGVLAGVALQTRGGLR